MSKSKGNVVAPEKVIKQYGSEILRFWVAMSDYQTDLKISDEILKQISEQYRKLRNTFRFLLANIDDLETIIPYAEMGEMDRWIVSKAQVTFDETHKLFGEYNFVGGMSVLNNFVVNELSGIYMDITKDRLYCDAKDDAHRRASQSAMAMIVKSLLGLVAPILTYTADEIMESAPAVIKGDAEDIFDIVYEPIDVEYALFDAEYMTQARVGFSEIVDGLKKEKTIKATLELVIYTESTKLKTLPAIEAEDWFVVSGIKSGTPAESLGQFEVEGDTFIIAKATEAKCPRCWKYHSVDEETLCERCDKVLNV
jgi:isoleucyl-tRNA synthetase